MAAGCPKPDCPKAEPPKAELGAAAAPKADPGVGVAPLPNAVGAAPAKAPNPDGLPNAELAVEDPNADADEPNALGPAVDEKLLG